MTAARAGARLPQVGNMSPDEPDAFPDAGLNLQDFARRECRSAYEAWRKAKEEVASAGGRGTIMSRLAGYVGPAEQHAPSRLVDIADEAAKALQDAVLGEMKSAQFIIRGIPKGEHAYVDIVDALLASARLVSWPKSVIACSGRRFEFIRVFQKEAASGRAEVPALVRAQTVAPLLVMDDLTAGERAVHCAIVEIWGGEIPDMLKAEERDERIIDYLKKQSNLSAVGKSTIKRYLQKRNAARRRRHASSGARK